MWHTLKHTNKCIRGIQEVEEEEKGAEKIQLKTKNFWNILKHNNLHIWKALQTVYDKYKKVHDKTHHSKCADCQRADTVFCMCFLNPDTVSKQQ